MIDFKRCVFSTTLFLIHHIFQVVAETCSNGKICTSPYTCCHGNCCHDNNDDYIYGYRMSFWNLWYFWFIILFVLMSCFGGCGYYKQRQRLLGGRSSSSSSRNTRRSRTIILTTTGEGAPYAYSGPGAEPYNNVFQPPPYSEVVLQPGLYPGQKESLPPYPGQNAVSERDTTVVNNDVGLPQPPPYTEIANQNRDLSPPTNQNAPQSAYQNTASSQSAYQNTTGDVQQGTNENEGSTPSAK